MSEPTTIGSYLRAARRRQRLSIERAAEDTRIRPEFLMRMESDEFDFLATAYVRGFLRTYARYLRVPVDPILKEFDRRHSGGRADTATMIALERRTQGVRERKPMNRWGVAAVLAGIALVALAFIGLLVNPEDEDETPARLAATNADEESPAPSATPDATPTPTPSVTPTPTATPAPDVLAFDDGILLEVTATRDPCWVEVDADGADLFGAVMEVGETQTFEAQEEMGIVLGFPAGVDVVVNGVEIPSENLHTRFNSPDGQDPIELILPDDAQLLL